MGEYHILFVCTGNTCRSPMAAFMLRQAADNGHIPIAVRSAGIAANDGVPISPEAAKVLSGKGLKGDHFSRRLRASDIDWANMVLSMTKSQQEAIKQAFPHARDKVFMVGEFLEKPEEITDPLGGGEDAYLETWQLINDSLPGLLSFIKHEINSLEGELNENSNGE